MRKLHTLALYALVAPALTLSSAAALADQAPNEGMDREQRSTQNDEATTQSTTVTTRSGASKSDNARTLSLGYMSTAPANGLHASNIIGADVTTTGGEDVGSVNDLLVDNNGQIVAVVVGVGGFLGLGEKNVAIGWDAVTKSGTFDDLELSIDQTREELTSAPDFDDSE